ncbi:MAG: endolytic transglycosylase MltG [Patescibacteria group bacterium]
MTAKRVFFHLSYTLLILFALIVIGFLRLVDAPGASAAPTTFTIASGESVTDIAKRLESQKLIRSITIFKAHVYFDGARSNFLTGDFTIPPAASTRAIINLLTTTPAAEEVSVRVPESATAKEVAVLLEKADVLPAADFLAAVQTTDSRTVAPDRTYDFLRDKPASATLEGYLFPDTYRFFTDATAAHVVTKFLDNFEAKVSSTILADIRTQRRTIFDVLTLASIVDQEVRTDVDRRIAAGIFLERMRLGIALQSDATVNYVTGKQALQPTLADLSANSAYNTYKHRGLPPGPIGNPSLSAIRATANPQASAYLFFLTTPEGETIFSKTYEEHLVNKRKYLQ